MCVSYSRDKLRPACRGLRAYCERDNRDTHRRKERAAQSSGAIQLRLTDGFASFTDENYDGAYGSPACRAPIGRALSGSRRARVPSAVLFHTPCRCVRTHVRARKGLLTRKQTRRKHSPSPALFSFFFISFPVENVRTPERSSL